MSLDLFLALELSSQHADDEKQERDEALQKIFIAWRQRNSGANDIDADAQSLPPLRLIENATVWSFDFTVMDLVPEGTQHTGLLKLRSHEHDSHFWLFEEANPTLYARCKGLLKMYTQVTLSVSTEKEDTTITTNEGVVVPVTFLHNIVFHEIPRSVQILLRYSNSKVLTINVTDPLVIHQTLSHLHDVAGASDELKRRMVQDKTALCLDCGGMAVTLACTDSDGLCDCYFCAKCAVVNQHSHDDYNQ